MRLTGVKGATAAKAAQPSSRPADAPSTPDGSTEQGRRPARDVSFPDIRGQEGLATRRQLEEHGWTKAAIRHRLGERWQLVYPRVVVPGMRRVVGKERLVAAQLWAGHHAVLTGLAGLDLLGLDHEYTVTSRRFLVPPGHAHRRHEDAEAHRTDRPLHPYRQDGCVQVMHPARCLLDAARWDLTGRDERIALTIAVLQQGIAKPLRVHHELRHTHRNDTVDVRDGLRAFERGAWSRPELVLMEALDTSTILPETLINPTLRLRDGPTLPTPDAYVREVALAIQVHSKTYHARDRNWQATVEGDAALTRNGIVVVAVTPTSLDQDPAGVVRDVEQTYSGLVGRPLPDIQVTPRSC